jgi:hypothetical protein
MKVSIIGAGRNRNGIGKYIANYFQKNGATVVSVIGTTEKTACSSSAALRQYGISAASYTDFYKMVEKERPALVAIASPSSTHYEYLLKCIEAGVHIFCEKPFIWDENRNMQQMLENIFSRAENKNIKVAMNCQWPFTLPYYEELCGTIDKQKTDSFVMELSPICGEKEMLLDSIPHALSLLFSVFGKGEINGPGVDLHSEKATIKFEYLSGTNVCKVLIRLTRKEQQPRDLSFGFNNKIVKRRLDLKKYAVSFTFANRTLNIADPLELSVRDFISAVSKQQEPRIGREYIMNNTILLKQIYDSC